MNFVRLKKSLYVNLDNVSMVSFSESENTIILMYRGGSEDHLKYDSKDDYIDAVNKMEQRLK